MPRLYKIVTGQKISSAMHDAAGNLRRQMTEEEKILWRHLRANRLHGFHFRRQQIVGKYVVDFYCHAASLVVELDGGIHMYQVARDVERASDLTTLGLLVLRFKNEDIRHNLDVVLERIAETCRARVAHAPTSPSL